MNDAPDFWLTSGFHLLRRDPAGNLAVTDDYLRAYFDRPEMRPPAEADAAEQALHRSLLADPARAVRPDEIHAMADADARENYTLVLRFRDLLLQHGTLEGAYMALFRGDAIVVPPLFIDQMVHAIARNVLDSCDQPFRLRAAELLFRKQKVTVNDGAIMLADEEIVERFAATGGFGSIGRLLVEAQTQVRAIDMDILTEANAVGYIDRSDRFDTVLDVSFTRPGLDGLCRVLEMWVAHFLQVEVTIHPVQAIRDERWAWHVGLDGEATGILNSLYEGHEVDEARLARLLSLFRLEFRDPASMLPRLAGRPVYLGMAMNAARELRLKPQNLLVNLPLAPRM